MLKDIIAISGQSGLFKLVASNQKTIIVEHLETKKRIPVYQSSKVSSLDDIAVYTTEEEIPLAEVFERISKIENKQQCSVQKTASNNDIKDYFEDVLPDYDKDRVYVSDMKKIITWYNVLQVNNMLNFEKEAVAEATSTESTETKEAKPKAEKAVKKAAPKAQKPVAPKATKAPAAQKKSVPVKK